MGHPSPPTPVQVPRKKSNSGRGSCGMMLQPLHRQACAELRHVEVELRSDADPNAPVLRRGLGLDAAKANMQNQRICGAQQSCPIRKVSSGN